MELNAQNSNQITPKPRVPIIRSVISIFSFHDYKSYLKAFLENKKNINRHWNLSAWARQLGFANTSVLANIINGHRIPGKKTINQLIHYFQFNEKEKRYFLDLVQLEKIPLSDAFTRMSLLEKLAQSHPAKQFTLLDSATFSTISNWYYYCIRELTKVVGFVSDPKWIQRHILKKISLPQIRNALSQMSELKLIKLNPFGQLRATQNTITTSFDVSDEGLKRFHEQCIERSYESIRTVALENREITNVTLSFDIQKIAEAKNAIRKFRDHFNNLFESEAGSHVYQLNIQLIPLTKTVSHEPKRK